jgi:hypothetical protein
MSIKSDLNYDVVEAVLSRKKENNPAQTKELLNVLINFHEALKPLVKQSRQHRRRREKESMATARNGASAASH